MIYKLEILLFGHILNPFWKSHEERRHKRGLVTQKYVMRHLQSYVDYIKHLKPAEEEVPKEDKKRIFSIWLQGEDEAPEIVKACWRSVRANCSKEFVVLDANSINDWISLPEHIKRKWEAGKIKPAHYSDICRLALLVKYGGVWLDATNYIESDFPQWLWDSDFFLYTSGTKLGGWYAFIQNCFIRSKPNNFLAKAWLDTIYEYWKNEDKAIDYFIHQLIFRMVVENNEYAKELYSSMPKIEQDKTHLLWYSYGTQPYDEKKWDEVTSSALFQKLEYKSKMAKTPEDGTFAYHLLNNYL